MEPGRSLRPGRATMGSMTTPPPDEPGRRPARRGRPVAAPDAARGVCERLDHRLARRGRPARRQRRHLRRRPLREPGRRRRRPRRPGSRPARRPAPLHARRVVVGDPRGRRPGRRIGGGRGAARAPRGDRRRGRRVAATLPLPPVQLDLRRDRRAVRGACPAARRAPPDPTEELTTRWVPFDAALAMIAMGEITDAMTIMGLQAVALERATRADQGRATR